MLPQLLLDVFRVRPRRFANRDRSISRRRRSCARRAGEGVALLNLSNDRLRDRARDCLEAALAAVEPRGIVHRALAGRSFEGVRSIELAAIGKAAVAMSRGALEALGDRVRGGVVIAPSSADDLPDRLRLYRGGHPLPNAAGVDGAGDLYDLAGGLGEDDLLLCLISGGGSALMTLPPDGVALTDVQAATDRMLRAGATIVELNRLRKHLDRLKGGRLAAVAAPARVCALVLSDVVGDPLDAIASGPVTPDPTTFADVLADVERLGVRAALPGPVVEHLEAGVRGEVEESAKLGDACFERVEAEIVGSNRKAAVAAASRAREAGFDTLVLTTSLTGEARQVGEVLAAIAREIRRHGRPVERPGCVVAAGETTVSVRGDGRGGRNQELALGAALALAGVRGAAVASFGTDGIDGPTDAAGAIAFGDTVARARAAGLDPRGALERNDSYPFFGALGDLVVTGPTGTNVMDLQLILVE